MNDLAEPGRRLATAALEHTLARVSGDPTYLLSAFEHNEEAVATAPSSLAGLFNRGLIASDLGLCRLAAKTWRQYEKRDPSSEWAQEARLRLSLLPCTEERNGLPSSADNLYSDAMERLLPAWAEARRKGLPISADLLKAIAKSGSELRTKSEEPMVMNVAHELSSIHDAKSLQAITSLVDGRNLFEREAYPEALKAFRKAAERMPKDLRWLAAWTDLWLSGTDANLGRFRTAEDRLARLARSPQITRSPFLMGKIYWTWGFSTSRAGRLQTGYDRLVRAEEEFTRGKYSMAAASVRTLKAEILAHLGFAQEAWRPRILSLRALQAAQGSFSFFHNGLIDGATFAERAGSYTVADAFLDEAAEVARSEGNTISEIEALLTKARLLRQRGFHTEATRDLRRALDSLQQIEDGPIKQRFKEIIQVGLWADPAYRNGKRDEELSAAGKFFAANGPRSLQLLTLHVQATRELQDGEIEAARHTLGRAIQVVRRLQADLGSEKVRIQQLDSVQDLFDQAIDLALSAHQPLYALKLLESARSGGSSSAWKSGDLQDFQLEAPRQAVASPADAPVVVVFGLTPETFVWWRVEGHAVRWGSREARPVDAEVQAALRAVPEGRATRAQLQRLYKLVLGDALHGVAPGHPLVLVPDGLLQQVPFSALWNSETGVRLIEERAISLQSSLAAALSEQVDAGQRSRRKDWRVIAVGDPAFDVTRLPWSRLPGAAEEAERVAEIYGKQGCLLTGKAAQAKAVRQALASSEVLHLSTHASVGAGAFGDTFVLAASSDGSSSGLVTAAELLPAKTPLRLAVLSGCSTLGARPSRSGGLLGLGREFVSRGIPATLGTLWTVGDRRLPDLMADFHRLIRQGNSAAEALRQSQRAYLAKHPDSCCDWAALELIGDLPAEPSTTR